MSSGVYGSDGLDQRGDDPPSRVPVGEPARRERSVHIGGAPRERPQAELGGADAVEKTTYVVGEGAEPQARPRGSYVARGAAGGGSVAVWIVVGVAALIGLIYVLGVFS